MPPPDRLPSRTAGQASGLFSEDVVEDGLIQRRIGDDLLQPAILLLELLDPPRLGHAHAALMLLPVVERRLADRELSAELGYGGTLFGLPEHLRDLLVGISGFFMDDPPALAPLSAATAARIRRAICSALEAHAMHFMTLSRERVHDAVSRLPTKASAPGTGALVLLSLPAAARELGLPVKAVRRLVSQGLLPTRILGGRPMILKRELERYLALCPR